LTFEHGRWQDRLDELRATHHVPGASLAVLADGEIHELASGVLHRGTGVAVTPDSVFQSGSIAKVYTATLVMQLVDAGLLDLDTRVVDVLPGFTVAQAPSTATIRQLLSHTSGIGADFTLDTGRGDDCLARYVDACAGVSQDCPPGTMVSYCSTGYAVLGRVVEVLTGQSWDDALRDRLFTPLGLTQSMTLPEEALRFRAAMGHVGEPGREPEPAPVWDFLPRSAGPYGRVLVTASDMVRFARMHLDGGAAPDGARLLTAEAVAAMRRRAVDTPDRWTFGTDGWGLGWALYDWDGTRGYGHDGASVGQFAYLRVVPDAGVAAVLLTNGGGATRLSTALLAELLAELAGVRLPDDFRPAPQPPSVDIGRFAGTYCREGVTITVSDHHGIPRARFEPTGGMKGFSPPIDFDLVPVSETLFAAPGQGAVNADWIPVLFTALPDGTEGVYFGMRIALSSHETDGVSIKTLSSRVVYENPRLSLREDQIEHADGSPGLYYVIDKTDFALVIPMENDGFHLVEQYRYPIQRRSWEFPAGSFPHGVTGTPDEMAAAELSEETGLTAGRLEKLGYLHSANGMTGEGVHVFLATDLRPGKPHREKTEQDMRQRWFPRGEVERMVRDGIMTDGPSLAAYLLLTLRT
jgi:CubicO group peptidase (beta-lactamase class C family)/8-oxo-dGTP pyrophosphatase MutT (NUDIX family)